MLGKEGQLVLMRFDGDLPRGLEQEGSTSEEVGLSSEPSKGPPQTVWLGNAPAFACFLLKA